MTEKIVKQYRIGIDARFYRKETAGIGRYSRELLRHIFALDHYNEYFVFITEADLAEWEIQQPNVHPVVVPIPHYTMAEQTALLAELYKQKLDLVHFLNFNHPVLYTRPFVTTLHDLTLMYYPAGRSAKSKVRFAAFIQIMRHALLSAKKVIAISEYSAHDAEKRLKVPHAKMEVIYEGGPDAHELLPGSKDATQKYLGTRDPYFLFVSQWRPHKGILTLIEAFNSFKQRTGLSHKLVLIGRQKVLEDQVKDAITNSPFADDILAPGFAPDEMLPALYHYSVACIVPSEYEGFGLPVLEAFTHGTAVISADSSSLPEVGGDGALYFPTKDAAGLCGAMERIVGEPGLRSNLIEKGRKHLRKFSWQRCAEQTLAVYYGVLEKRR